MTRQIKIAPSLLSADFSKLAQEVKRMEAAGADMFHIDVMDGHFVPNITVGPAVVASIRPHTKLVLDVHLMIEDPSKYAGDFIKAGADILTFHTESCPEPNQLILKIRASRIKVGVALNPPTPLSVVDEILSEVDMVLIMTVNPGFAGQKFIAPTLDKMRQLRRYYQGDLQVDGGINYQTAKQAVEAGANVLVAGTYLFGSRDPKHAMEQMKKLGYKLHKTGPA